MTPDERWALIHQPFVITSFGTLYRWAGANTGGYITPDLFIGGRRIPRVNDDEGGGRSRVSSVQRRGREWFHPESFEFQVRDPDSTLTKFTIAGVFGDLTPTEEQIIHGKE